MRLLSARRLVIWPTAGVGLGSQGAGWMVSLPCQEPSSLARNAWAWVGWACCMGVVLGPRVLWAKSLIGGGCVWDHGSAVGVDEGEDEDGGYGWDEFGEEALVEEDDDGGEDGGEFAGNDDDDGAGDVAGGCDDVASPVFFESFSPEEEAEGDGEECESEGDDEEGVVGGCGGVRGVKGSVDGGGDGDDEGEEEGGGPEDSGEYERLAIGERWRNWIGVGGRLGGFFGRCRGGHDGQSCGGLRTK